MTTLSPSAMGAGGSCSLTVYCSCCTALKLPSSTATAFRVQAASITGRLSGLYSSAAAVLVGSEPSSV